MLLYIANNRGQNKYFKSAVLLDSSINLTQNTVKPHFMLQDIRY